MIDSEHYRFGSAGFATTDDIQASGMFDQTPGGLLVGFDGNRPLFYDGAGGVLITAGARSGKLRDILAYNICAGICLDSMVILDVKGELACISQNQTADNKACYYWNPAALHGLPQDRFNPLENLTRDNPLLVSEVKALAQNLIPDAGKKEDYFPRRAQEFLEAICLTLVTLNGSLTYPELYHVVNLIPGNSDAWLDFAFEMSECGYPVSRRVEEEIANSREHSGNGFHGILGDLFKSLQCLSDPVLMQSLSPPFTVSFNDLCRRDQRANFYLILPPQYLQIWSPILKSFFVTAHGFKSLAPQAPRQTWIIDEAAQLHAFPLLKQLFSIGAGMGVRPVAVYQSSYQMDATGQSARQEITSSAACRLYFGVRDFESAQVISSMLGAQTLEYDDRLAQSQARLAKQQAAQALLNGGDPFQIAQTLAHHSMASTNRTKQYRSLRTPDEILNDVPDGMYLFTDALPKPAYVSRKPYWTQRFMAGRYLPNPYHPPMDRVPVQTAFGQRMRGVITERVPARYAHLPQYRSGLWSYVKV